MTGAGQVTVGPAQAELVTSPSVLARPQGRGQEILDLEPSGLSYRSIAYALVPASQTRVSPLRLRPALQSRTGCPRGSHGPAISLLFTVSVLRCGLSAPTHN